MLQVYFDKRHNMNYIRYTKFYNMNRNLYASNFWFKYCWLVQFLKGRIGRKVKWTSYIPCSHTYAFNLFKIFIAIYPRVLRYFDTCNIEYLVTFVFLFILDFFFLLLNLGTVYCLSLTITNWSFILSNINTVY